MVKYELEPHISDLEAICRRFDINKNQMITLKQVRTIVATDPFRLTSNKAFNNNRLTMSSPRRKKIEESKPKDSGFRQLYYSPNRTKVGKEYKTIYPSSYIYSSPKSNTDIIGSLSPIRETHHIVKKSLSPKKKNKNHDKEFLEFNENTKKREENNFLNFLSDLISHENIIEKLKCDLSLRSDFNLQDSFRIFEIDKNGYVSFLDFKSGCNYLGVFPKEEEIKLIFKRYTNGGEILIR